MTECTCECGAEITTCAEEMVDSLPCCGDRGEKGDRGLRGIQGKRGQNGPKGTVGPKGLTGDRGLPGKQVCYFSNLLC